MLSPKLEYDPFSFHILGDYLSIILDIVTSVVEGCQLTRFAVFLTPQSGQGPFAFIKRLGEYVWKWLEFYGQSPIQSFNE